MSRRTRGRSDLLQALNLAMRRSGAQGTLFSHAVASRLGITSSDLECLDIVVLDDAVTPGRLAEVTGLTTGGITGVIDRLEQAGFVRREPDPADRRRVLVRPIHSALRRVEPFYSGLQERMSALLEVFDAAELERFLAFFDEVNRVFEDETRRLKETSPIEPTGKTARGAEYSETDRARRPTREP